MAALVLITTQTGSAPNRHRLHKSIASIGSASDADIMIAGLPANWAAIYRDRDDKITIRRLAANSPPVELGFGQSAMLDGISIRFVNEATRVDLELLSDKLGAAETTAQAIAELLDAVISGTNADIGAVILSEREGYTVALARDNVGNSLADAESLLSDTVVAEVLGSGNELIAEQLAGTAYQRVHSVVALGLGGVVCLPLRMSGRVFGAIFLGGRGKPLAVSEEVRSELRTVCTLAIPFVAQLRRAASRVSGGTSDLLVGDSKAMQDLRSMVSRIAPTDLSVLVTGPSGAGKEVVAKALHGQSSRSNKPLVAINCAAIAPSLLDAELFGYRKGAFTGALADRAGLIESAAGGVLFLDEIGDMPLTMQASLLRVLEQREVRRLGDLAARPVDFRLVAATHRDLHAEVTAGRFREDLLFRIAEVKVSVPPLAARGEDIVLLAVMFMRQTERQLGLSEHELPAPTKQALLAHHWPGNVRELKAAMRRAVILADSKQVRVADLQLGESKSPAETASAPSPLGDPTRPLEVARDEFVRRYVEAAVERHGGDREAAAKELGIGVRSLYRYIA